MKIVYAASEINPFASTGGLADVAGSLPRALAHEPGVEVWRVMPLYHLVAERGFHPRDTGVRIEVPVGFRTYAAEIWVADDPAPTTYFIRRDEFFDRSHLYGAPEKDYDDNFERFVFFQKAVVALIDALELKADVVHCNDWQTGLLPLFLRHGVRGMGREARERTVFTIHNLAFQGIFPGSAYSITNLPFLYFHMDGFEFYGNVSCMKAGITSADCVTTVSRAYAREIQTEAFGCGLHGLLSRLGPKLVGIQNGVDYADWDPGTDQQITARFEPSKLEGKQACRLNLAHLMGLPLKAERPILGMITRLTDQKGMDLLAEAMPEIMKRDVSLVILGLGMQKYHDLCRQWAQKWPDRFAVKLDYDTPLARKIIAGSDMLLMPSKFEPSGLSQLYAMRYGTIPLVTAVGGLDDTIEQVSSDGTKGTGFKFSVYKPAAMLASLDQALGWFCKAGMWQSLMLRAMQQDVSWTKSAREYLNIYNQIAPKKALPQT
ncbi:MAG: glycogen synthase GlgA [Verrucomicrobia bacterium]|nr:MAG: glycogen synthase GlgA [Verrucomicrobiota bacterium]